MTGQDVIQDKLVALKNLAPAGYAVALHVHFTAPTFLFQTYDREWLEYYSKKGLVMTDPTVHWGFENRGAVDWADLAESDTQGVMTEAANYGLKFGMTCSFGDESRPSIGSFARGDRAFNPDEAQELGQHLADLHALTDNLKVLSPETAEALRKLSIEYTHPH